MIGLEQKLDGMLRLRAIRINQKEVREVKHEPRFQKNSLPSGSFDILLRGVEAGAQSR